MMGEAFYLWMVGRIIIPKNQLISLVLEMIAIAQVCQPVFVIDNNRLVEFQQLIVFKTYTNPEIYSG